MEIRQFMYVSMAAECGSFTKAAEKLFITQPALSSYISKLEEELGVRLFDRSVTPLGLTYAGEKYLAYARDILRQADGLEREIRDISNHLAEHPVTWEIHALYREEAYLGKVEEEFLKMAARGLEWNKKKLLPAL